MPHLSGPVSRCPEAVVPANIDLHGDVWHKGTAESLGRRVKTSNRDVGNL